jgi:hypothetical protein
VQNSGINFGYCPICEKKTIFYQQGKWLRDHLRCIRCFSVPRWRALFHVLSTHFPNWRDLEIHESSPGGASSKKIEQECKHYQSSFYFSDTPSGEKKEGKRCENIEKQTFGNEIFDIVITQDVLEHVFYPSLAFTEIARTLKQGGCIFSLSPGTIRKVQLPGQ